MSSFGNNLKSIRSEKGVSQGQLAELLGIHPSHVSRYERDLTAPSVEMVKRFADALEVSTDSLVYGTGDEKITGQLSDSELLAMFRKAQGLNENDKSCIKTMLKAFLFQKDMQQQLAS